MLTNTTRKNKVTYRSVSSIIRDVLQRKTEKGQYTTLEHAIREVVSKGFDKESKRINSLVRKEKASKTLQKEQIPVPTLGLDGKPRGVVLSRAHKMHIQTDDD